MNPIIFALIAYLGWGGGDIFGTLATRKIGGYLTTFWYLLLGALVFSFYIPFSLNFLKNLNLQLFLIILALSLIGTIGLVAFYEGLKRGNASLVGAISASFAVVSVILSVIFLKESINLNQVIAIITIFGGLTLSSLDFSTIRKEFKIDVSIFLAFVAMLSWGIYWAFIKIPVKEIGWYWPDFIGRVLSLPFALFLLKTQKLKMSHGLSKNTFFQLLANAAIVTAGSISYNVAIEKGLVAVVAPIAGSYPTLFVILAAIIFKDPIKRQQVLGIIITLTGIVLLSVFSV